MAAQVTTQQIQSNPALATQWQFSTGGGAMAPKQDTAAWIEALKRAGIPAELHIYASGNHDFGVRQREDLLPRSWPHLCVNWLKSYNLYAPKP